jgi:bis(5'-nucleosyl)-tetraphosphatase (symmetrical)
MLPINMDGALAAAGDRLSRAVEDLESLNTGLLAPQRRATYAVGDVQGCFDDLLRLLDKIDFDPDLDQLWFTGDLVNRGPNSLQILRFVRSLGSSAISVLGNHDLYLLAAAAGNVTMRKKDTISDVLNAPDCEELLFWLRHQPLLHHDARLGYTLIHAGLPPQWDLTLAQSCARELEAVLQNAGYEEFFRYMYGDKPRRWQDDLQGWDRLRFIANCLTQLRYCDRKGRIDLTRKGNGCGKKGLVPWFKVPKRASEGLEIIFGHWAALKWGRVNIPGLYPLDSGCVNGGRFTALRLEDVRLFRSRCYNAAFP